MIRKFFLKHSDRFISQWLILILDMLIVLISAPIAFWIVYNLRADQLVVTKIVQYCFGALFAYVIGSLVSKSYRGVIRHTSLEDAINVVLGTLIGLFILIGLNIFIDKTKLIFDIRYPYALLFLHNFFTTFLLVVFRLGTKLTYFRLLKPRVIGNNTIIYGAGEIGMLTKNVLLNDGANTNRIVGFLDDNPNKVRKRLQGIEVYGSDSLTSEFIETQRITTLVFALENLNPTKKAKIIDLCLEHKVSVKQAPPLNDWIKGQVSSHQIRHVKIEDLLQRMPLKLNQTHLQGFFESKVILVSGAAGSIGSEIVKQLVLNRAKKIVILDHAETPIFNLYQELIEQGLLVDNVFEEIISVTNPEELKRVFNQHRPHIVFHAAALKHVPLMERNPKAAFDTNVKGSKAMADISGAFGVEKFVMVSTDKAVRPTNVMGATKRIAEMYVKGLDDSAKYSTKYIITRFGNVLGSNGSVIPTFKRQIANGGPVKVTHEDITRYFMTIPEACQLVLEAGVMGSGGETYIFDMGEPVKILDLAKKMIALSGLRLGADIELEFTGLRPGEKLFEELWHGDETQLSTHHEKIMIAETSTLSFEATEQLIASISTTTLKDNTQEEVSKLLIDFANNGIASQVS